MKVRMCPRGPKPGNRIRIYHVPGESWWGPTYEVLGPATVTKEGKYFYPVRNTNGEGSGPGSIYLDGKYWGWALAEEET